LFVSSDGHIVTNAHVVAGCRSIGVASGFSTATAVQVLARDTANDLALLKSDLRPNATVSLRSGVRVGEDIAAFGFPLSGLLSSSGNFTLGNVSSAAGIGDDTRFLQITSPVQPGNSGGPLVDVNGNVVGVVVSKLDAIKLASFTDDIAQNVTH
jgi:S1-C subfamily serine protease